MIERMDVTTLFLFILAIGAPRLAFLQDHSLPLQAFEVTGRLLNNVGIELPPGFILA